MRLGSILIAGVIVCALGASNATAGSFLLGTPFNVNVADDPAGSNSPTNAVLLGAGPTLIDGGLLTVSQTISGNLIQFTVTTTTGGPLVGAPGGFWKIDITGIQTTPAALDQFWTTFLDANGGSHPFPFPGTSLGTNPLNPAQSVSGSSFAPGAPVTSQELFAQISPFNQGPTNFGNGGAVPITFLIGGEYVGQSVPTPVPASVYTLGIALLGIAGYEALKQRKRAAN